MSTDSARTAVVVEASREPNAKPPRWRQRLLFAVASVLFLAWLSWLGTQAVERVLHPFPVVSPAQLATASADWVVRIEADREGKPANPVRVQSVRWSREVMAVPPDAVPVANLADCSGFVGSGEYLLPVVKVADGWRVALPPTSPGLPMTVKPRMYPATADVLRQAELLRGR